VKAGCIRAFGTVQPQSLLAGVDRAAGLGRGGRNP